MQTNHHNTNTNHLDSTTKLLKPLPKAHLTPAYDNINTNLTYESMSHPDHRDDTIQIHDTTQIHGCDTHDEIFHTEQET